MISSVIICKFDANHMLSIRVGRRWISRLLALGLYAMFLMPGFLQGVFFLLAEFWCNEIFTRISVADCHVFCSFISVFLFKPNSEKYSLRRSAQKQVCRMQLVIQILTAIPFILFPYSLITLFMTAKTFQVGSILAQKHRQSKASHCICDGWSMDHRVSNDYITLIVYIHTSLNYTPSSINFYILITALCACMCTSLKYFPVV